MPKLDIHLQEGFEGQSVTVSIDGHARLQRDAVTSKRALGLAEHVSFEVDPGPHSVLVTVANPVIEKQIDVVVSGPSVYLGLGLAGAELRVRVRETPFGYG